MRTTTIKRIFPTFIILFVFLSNAVAQEMIFTTEDSIFLEDIIKRHPATLYETSGKAIIAIAEEFIGQQYVAGTLESPGEPLYISHSRLDCTTLVETVLSIYLTINENKDSFNHICRNLERIRYRDGIRNGYTSRLHYISWWIDNNKEFIEEFPTLLHTAIQKLNLNYMSTNHDKYAALKENASNIRIITEFEKPYYNIEVKYIPKENVRNLNKTEVKDGDIIAIVTSINGLDIAHMGFAKWHDNTLHMIHASSSAGKVIDDTTNLHEYLKSKKNHLGIRVLRLK